MRRAEQNLDPAMRPQAMETIEWMLTSFYTLEVGRMIGRGCGPRAFRAMLCQLSYAFPALERSIVEN